MINPDDESSEIVSMMQFCLGDGKIIGSVTEMISSEVQDPAQKRRAEHIRIEYFIENLV